MRKHKSFFLRHGRSLYTGVLPDITEAGMVQVTRSFQQGIIPHLDGGMTIGMVTSPQARARGSINIGAGILGYDTSKIMVEPAIRCVDYYTDAGRALPWPLLAGETSLELAYIDHPRFDTGIDFEKRSDVKVRFFRYLQSLPSRFLEGQLPDALIHASHYEVLHSLIKVFGLPNPLTYAEVVCLEFVQYDDSDTIWFEVTFRGCRGEFVMKSRDQSIREHFDP